MEVLLLKNMIAKHTHGHTINIKGIANFLGIDIQISNIMSDQGQLYLNEEGKPVIALNEKADKQTKYTLMVIAMADYILKPQKLTQSSVCYDSFFINDIFSLRHHYRMLLATRLAFPEHVIACLTTKIVTENSDVDYSNFVANSNYLPQFIRSCIDDSSALFLLKNTNDLPI